jgi:hypothetical protein
MFAIEHTFTIAKFDDLMHNQEEVEQKPQEYQAKEISSRPASRPSSVAWNSFLGLLALITTPYIR